MSANYLYMFEFVVDDLIITKLNECAPEEFPTCVEFSFRSSVSVTVWDHEINRCWNTASKKGKSCLFALEKPITPDDKLLVHVFKKRNDKCKFLIGVSELHVKDLFDAINKKTTGEEEDDEVIALEDTPLQGEEENVEMAPTMDEERQGEEEEDDAVPPIEYERRVSEAISKMQSAQNLLEASDQKSNSSLTEHSKDNGDDVTWPISELTKKFLPLHNLKRKQTGYIVVILRLSCMGETIVSPFPYCGRKKQEYLMKNVERIKNAIEKCKQQNNVGQNKVPCTKVFQSKSLCKCKVAEGKHNNSDASDCERNPSVRCPCKCSCKKTRNPCGKCQTGKQNCSCKGKTGKQNSCGQCQTGRKCPCMLKCTKKPDVSAYDEFEANMNESAVIVRVLKKSHKVTNITEGDRCHEKNCTPSCKCRCPCPSSKKLSREKSPCRCPSSKKITQSKCPSRCPSSKNMKQQKDPCKVLSEVILNQPFFQNFIKRKTGGFIKNGKNLPRIRENAKYPGNLKSISNLCPCGGNCCKNCKTLEEYRKKRSSKINCCLQVAGKDIDNALKGLNKRVPQGIEVCRKGTCEPDTDVFVLKLGKKQKCRDKENIIEVELKTPKQFPTERRPKITRETQIEDEFLDSFRKRVSGNEKIDKKKGKAKGKPKNKGTKKKKKP